MPYWAVVIIIVILVVGYYLLTQQARERRRGRAGGDFAKIPNFYPNQTYADVGGEAAVGIDDRRRRLAVARRHAQPRTRVYSFAHILSAEIVQDERVIALVGTGPPPLAGPGATDRPQAEAAPDGGLFGSTRTDGRRGLGGPPVVKPELGQVSSIGVRITLRNAEAQDQVLVRFYLGKPVNVDSVEGERALAEAQVLLGSLNIAVKRAGRPPGGPQAPAPPRTPVR